MRDPLLKHLSAILLLPGMVTLVIPILILAGSLNRSGCIVCPPTTCDLALPVVGVVLLSIGLQLMVKTISLFATIGKGTLAPWQPPQNLVLRGVYLHVRNPMISGVFAILLGEAAVSESLPLAIWFLCFLLANLIYIPLFEEPALEKRFGKDYRLYKANVPRWIPRVHAWDESL